MVTQADGGSTVYNYKYYSNPTGDVSVKVINELVCDQSAPNFPPAPDEVDLQRGELVNVSMYNSEGTLLKETKHATEYTNETTGVNGLIVKSYYSFLLATEYELKTAKKTKTTTLEWTYNPAVSGVPVGKITETYFDSPYHSFASRVVRGDSDGVKRFVLRW